MKNEELVKLRKKYEELLDAREDIKKSIESFNKFKNDQDIQRYLTIKEKIKKLMFEIAATKLDIYSESDTRLQHYREEELDRLNIELTTLLANEAIAKKVIKYNNILAYIKNNKVLDDDNLLRTAIKDETITSDNDKFVIVGFSTDADGTTKWNARDIESGNAISFTEEDLINLSSKGVIILLSNYITNDENDSFENLRFKYFKEAVFSGSLSGNFTLKKIMYGQKK